MLSREIFEQHLTDVKCGVRSCTSQGIFVEEIRNLDVQLTKKIDIDGFVILCKHHHLSLIHKRSGNVISFMKETGELFCNRCGKSWMNTMPEHMVPKTCKFCTNTRWNKAYVKERIEVGVKKK